MRIRYKKNRMVQFYESNYLTTIPHEPPPPYPGHGFVCGGGESCLRTEMARIMERDRRPG